MRRILAAVAAIAMLAAGYTTYQLRTGGDLPFQSKNGRGAVTTDSSAPSTGLSETMHFEISCLSDVEHACASASNVGQSAFTIESASATEKALSTKSDKAPQAWVTTSLHFERVRRIRPDLRVAGGLGSSPIVAVTRTAATTIADDCLLTLACLGSKSRVSWPRVGSGASLWAATASVQALAGHTSPIPALDDIVGASEIVTAIRDAKNPAPIEAVSNLTQVRLLDAAVMLKAQVDSIGAKGVTTVGTDAPPVSFVLVVSDSVTDRQAKQLVESLKRSFDEDSFDPPLATTVFPDPGLANEIAQRLQ